MTAGSMNKKMFQKRNIFAVVWDEFVYSSHLVALGDILALFSLSIILKVEVSISFFVVVYLSILAINFFNRYEDAGQDVLTNSERSKTVQKYFKYMPYAMGTLFVSSFLITAYFASFNALIFMMFLFGLGILYSIFLKNITRNVIGFKNFMTALPYGLLVVFMAIYANYELSLAIILIAVFYFIRIFINTAYFDIKDMDSDKKEGLKTLAVVYGEQRTKKILLFINAISIVPIFAGIYLNVLPLYSLGILFTVFYALIYLGKKRISNQSLMYNVVVDGEFIFWLPYLLVGRVL